MKAFYVYGICPVPVPSHTASVKGIDGCGSIFIVSHKDIGAVASEVLIEDFHWKEADRKTDEDIERLKDKALSHAKIVEIVSNYIDGEIIPMKFGTIFKTKKSLLAMLRGGYRGFKQLFKKLQRKEEWSVKVYVNQALLEQKIKRVSPEIRCGLHALSEFAPGEKYFLMRDLDQVIQSELKKYVEDRKAFFMARFRKMAEYAYEHRLLGRELTGKPESMFLNGAFLVKKDLAASFLKEIDDMQKKFSKQGFIFERSGPWPPYSFVE